MSTLIRCPLHADDTPSCSINVAKGVYKCFGCEAQGDLFSLAVLAGKSVIEAARMAYDEGDGTFSSLVGPHRIGPYVQPVLGNPTEKASGWLRRRGIEINEQGQITNIDAQRLPYFEEGETVLGITAWCAVLEDRGDPPQPRLEWEQWRYYRVMRKQKGVGKYYATPGFPRSRTIGVAGMREESTVYVGEGVLDGLALLLAQAPETKGLDRGSVYYTFGSSLTRDQAILLATLRGDRRLCLVFDNDEAGMDATFALLRVFPDAEVLAYPGKDPGEAILGLEPWAVVPGMEWMRGRVK